MTRAATRWFERVGAHELGTLIALVLIVATVWGFAELAGEVMEGDTASFDERVLLSMRTPGDLDDPVGPEILEEIGRDLTALGGVAFLGILTLAVTGFLLIEEKYRSAIYLVVAVVGGVVVSSLLKGYFERPRPDLVAHGSHVYTASFPSGHSMMSTAVFLTLAALLARFHSSPAVRAYLLGTGALLALLVGASRVYLGVHWPTDVLAGWTAGTAWAVLCWLLARQLQKQRTLEDSDSAT